jgi:hypothetical protein
VRRLRSTLAGALVAVALMAFVFSSFVPASFAQDTSLSYKLVNEADGTLSYTLNVIVPQGLNDYYRGLSHRSTADPDFPKFVTPYTVKPIADCLRQIYPDDEDFANGVLTLIHQIPYEETIPQFYPVETLLRNKGDCDMFSILAAAIMKAGGLEVTLFHYKTEEHMNIGVHLNSAPTDARLDVYSFESGGVTYYVAECTSSNWQEGWRVGECPDDLKNAPMQVVTLENSEPMSPGQVSASFKKLEATALIMNVSPFFTTEGSTLTVNGRISPAVPNQNLTLYCSVNGESWQVLDSTVTWPDGQFTYAWESDATGELQVRASWTGNDRYAGTTSETQSTLILPFYLLALIALAIVLVAVCVMVFLVTRSKRKPLEPTNAETVQTPEIPAPPNPNITV